MTLKYLKASSIALAFLTMGCASTTSPTLVGPKGAETGEQAEPAKYAKFANILAASKLQISKPNAKPGSKYELAKDGDFSGIVNENFYVDKGSEAFVFKMEGYKLRNELRIQENFKTNLPNKFYHLSAELFMVNPQESVKNSEKKRREMTVLQVHNKGIEEDGTGYIPHPLLRVVWIEERKGIKDSFWAVIKKNALSCKKVNGEYPFPECKGSYDRVLLGPSKAPMATKFNIIVGGEKLIIKVDGETKVERDLGYWSHFYSYFKAGVYNQFKNGQSEAHFYQLDYTVDDKILADYTPSAEGQETEAAEGAEEDHGWGDDDDE